MRLLNLKCLDLVEFMDFEKPPYSVLSHTWGAEEISLQELHSQHPDVKRKNGWTKIMNFARKGNENGFEWGWVDTCCIDKTSSAELSEAINSMFKWCQGAESCYAYLSDVFSPRGVQPWALSRTIAEQFASSRWFTRGWTLQDLLAPSRVVFYLQDWTIYGTKSSFKDEIFRITGIPAAATTQPTIMGRFSVAERISWVSKRQTTRPEDISYCLLGILGVHMPLLYGEGTRAFIRLQEEVIRVGNDPTIFAWQSNDTPHRLPTAPADSWETPLAPSPKQFINAGKTKRYFSRDKQYGPWFVTNFGIRIEGLPMLRSTEAEPLLTAAGFQLENKAEYAIALLGCYRADEDKEIVSKQYGIALYKHDDIYYRFHMPESLLLLDSSVRMSERVNCILHFSYGRPWLRLANWWVSVNWSPWVVRQLPEKIHGFNHSSILERSKDYVNTFGYSFAQRICSLPFQAVIFSNDVKKEEFFVVVRYPTSAAWSWISIITNTSRDDLLRQIDQLYSSGGLDEHEDQASAPLGDGKEVLTTVVRGVKDGKRVFYLDVCIRDIN